MPTDITARASGPDLLDGLSDQERNQADSDNEAPSLDARGRHAEGGGDSGKIDGGHEQGHTEGQRAPYKRIAGNVIVQDRRARVPCPRPILSNR